MAASGVRAWILRGSALAALAMSPGVATGQPSRPPAKVTAQQCNSAYESAQVNRKARKLRAAREQLLLCSQAQCPAPITADCGPWLREVESAMPSVVIVARDTGGSDVPAVKVSVDGTLLAPRLSGVPLDVDPGEHTFTFEPEHGARVEQKLLVNVGEKNRQVQVLIRAEEGASGPKPAEPGPAPGTSPSPATPDEGSHGSFVPGIVVGTVGLAALGVSIGLYVDAKNGEDSLRSTCAPSCAQSSVDSLRNKGIASDVTWGVGAAGVGVGALMMILLRPQPAKATTGALWPTVTPTRAGAAAGLSGRF